MTDVVRLVIRGRVQGVGFRAWTRGEAERRGLSGWVRNRRDGTVEAVLAGPAEAVTAMTEACRRGPGGATVDAVESHAAEAGEAPEGAFQQRATE
ncbi:acylphosphatase [Enterovirga sp.]|uniref:acylphosphatase n=1 Tax=Enterovirga sp. TaxID=2026350 RepID=UPI0026128D04|nr:acylphosphatase [Enterovirga sp.]MDB5591436.1 acylphosphatase [Enterovirga sp.]